MKTYYYIYSKISCSAFISVSNFCESIIWKLKLGERFPPTDWKQIHSHRFCEFMCATFHLTSHLICIFISARRHAGVNSIKLSQLNPLLLLLHFSPHRGILILIPRAEFLLFRLKSLFVREKWICFHAAHTRPQCVLCAAQLWYCDNPQRRSVRWDALDEKQQAGRVRMKRTSRLSISCSCGIPLCESDAFKGDFSFRAQYPSPTLTSTTMSQSVGKKIIAFCLFTLQHFKY